MIYENLLAMGWRLIKIPQGKEALHLMEKMVFLGILKKSSIRMAVRVVQACVVQSAMFSFIFS